MRGIDGSLEPVIEGSRIVAEFDEGAVAGSAGCNRYRGSCRFDDGVVFVGVLATTRKLCQRPPGVMEQESRYLELLAGATRYSVDADNTLTFTDDSNTLLLVMTRAGGRHGEDER